jgi:hypothetical protein
LVDADVCGHIFALADPGELTLTPLKVVNKPGRYEITNGHPRSADSDASQDSVKALRERLEGLLTIDPEATISQEPLPAEIELALQRISGGGDLLWLDSLLRELPGILPVPEEPMQYHSLEEQNWHAIPDTRTMRGNWSRETDAGVEEIRVRIAILAPPRTTNEEHPANRILLKAFRQGADYSMLVSVECEPYRGTQYLLGSDGTFKSLSCVDDEGKFTNSDRSNFEHRELPSRPSRLGRDAARSLWQALDHYLPQLPE